MNSPLNGRSTCFMYAGITLRSDSSHLTYIRFLFQIFLPFGMATFIKKPLSLNEKLMRAKWSIQTLTLRPSHCLTNC